MGWWWGPLCSTLNQHTVLDFYSASSLKQQSAGRHVEPLRHIILIPSIPVFALSLYCCVHSGEATNTILLSLLWPDWGSNPWSTAFEVSTLMQLYKYKHKYVINIKLVVDFVCVNSWSASIVLLIKIIFHTTLTAKILLNLS